MRAEGHAVGRYALHLIVSPWLAHAQYPAATLRTTVAAPAAIVTENLLLNQPAATASQVWVGDITYPPLSSRSWYHLATRRDTYSRRVAGWQLEQHAPIELVLNAPEQALMLRQPSPSLIIHVDRGSQYTSAAGRTRIAKAQALASFSRLINSNDNTQAEAGWSTLKTELLPYGDAFVSLIVARLKLAYDLDCRHSALGYRSPH